MWDEHEIAEGRWEGVAEEGGAVRRLAGAETEGFTCRRPWKGGFKESGDVCKVMLGKK